MPLLKDMNTLARIIEKRRDRQGMLHLDLPETELDIRRSGQGRRWPAGGYIVIRIR